MDAIGRATHPLGAFDLTAIGIVLVIVMAIMAVRRIVRGPARRHEPEDIDMNEIDYKEIDHDPR